MGARGPVANRALAPMTGIEGGVMMEEERKGQAPRSEEMKIKRTRNEIQSSVTSSERQ